MSQDELGGRQVTRFKREGEQYDVIVQVDPAKRNTPGDISNIFVRGRGDAMVPLSSLVSARESVTARELNHFGQALDWTAEVYRATMERGQ